MVQHIKVTGAREIERALLALPEKVAKKIGRAALRKAFRPVLLAARAKVPVREGRLRKSLALRVDQLRQATELGRVISALVFSSDKGFKYRPRTTDNITTIKGKRTKRRYDYQVGSLPSVYGRFVEFGIPGKPAQPFLRPAFDEGAGPALAVLAKELGEGIEREAKSG